MSVNDHSKVLLIGDCKEIISLRDRIAALGVSVYHITDAKEPISPCGFTAIVYKFPLFDLNSYLLMADAMTRFNNIPFILVSQEYDEQIACFARKMNIPAYVSLADLTQSGLKELVVGENAVLQDHATRTKTLEYNANHVLDYISDVYIAADADWTITYVNKAAERMYSMRRADMVGKNAWDVFPQTKSMFFYEECLRSVRERVVVQVSGISPLTGKWLYATTYPTSDGGLALHFTDRNDYRQLEHEMARQRTNLQKLIDNVGDLIWSVDHDLKIILCNRSYADFVFGIAGIKPTEGTFVLWDTFDDAFCELRRSQYEQAMSGATFTSVDKVMIDGAERFMETRFAPIHQEEGIVSSVCCHSRDVTEQITHLQKIERQNIQLRDIAHIQSHYVRAPVARVLGLSEIFCEKGEGSMDNEEIMTHVKNAALELDMIIRSIVERTDSLDMHQAN